MPLNYQIAERTLTNGLRVIVNEDRSITTVTVNLWVGVGSRHEVAGRTGFAHLFEHLMFQGSENVASGEHFSELMARGAGSTRPRGSTARTTSRPCLAGPTSSPCGSRRTVMAGSCPR
ncbi:insulinase family protein [Arsenicicoccus cauae]|uniref:M16 family metallopeptidase n=1 Tax=Arsenicicoccus cauae TaxID=2663847 RepID=UPI00370DCC0D